MTKRCLRTTPAGRVSHGFTLIELLAAMAVLVVMIFMLFRFISGAQRVWSVSNATTEVYEKARIAMDIITRDLHSAVARADDVPGSAIRFQQLDGSTLRFVSTGVIGATPSASLLCEVGYKHDGTDYLFRRATQNAASGNWNPYRDRSGPESTVNQQTGFQEVVGGVLGLQFICYDDSMTPQLWNAPALVNKLPYAVDVRMRIIDDKSFTQWELLGATEQRARLESQTALTFSKIVFLGGRQ